MFNQNLAVLSFLNIFECILNFIDMKINFFLLAFLSFLALQFTPNTGRSQPTTWAQPGAHWYYSEGDIFYAYGYFEIWEAGDTTFSNGIVCDILRTHRAGIMTAFPGGTYNEPGPTWYTYQSNDTLFIYYNNQFNILFIDNQLPGELFITGPDIYNACAGDTIVIDSLYSVTISGFTMNKIVPVMPDWWDGQWPPGGASIAYHYPIYTRFGSTAFFIPAPNCITDVPFGPLRCYSDSSGFTFTTGVVPSCDYITGLGDELEDSSSYLTIGSNPVNEILTIQFATNNFSEDEEIEMYTITGKKLQSHIVKTSEEQINVSHLSAGTYLIKIKNRPQLKPVSFIKL